MKEYKGDQYCFQDSNSSCRKNSISLYFYITLYIFFSLISVFTVFLNLLVIISISHFKYLHTPTNLLILSLAVSDLLVGLIVIPSMTVAILEPCWILGEYFCALLLYTTFLCASSSLSNLVLISIDRYVAVCDPLRYHLKISLKRTIYCISIIWGFCVKYDAVLVKLLVNIQVPSRCFEECYFVKGDIGVTICALVISMIIPCSIILTLYFRIFVVARSQARKVFSKGDATMTDVANNLVANKSERKAAKTLGMVVFNYLFCWIPIYFTQSIYFASGNSLTAFICFLPLVNSFINPIIYAFFYPWFKETAKRILNLKMRHY